MATKKKKRMSKKKRVIILTLELVVLVIAVVALAATLWGTQQLGRVQTDEEFDENKVIINDIQSKSIEGYYNIAVFGVDARDNSLGEGNRSDTIMIISLNRETNDVKMVSVYRDTYLMQEDNIYDKATHAYSKGGPKLAVDMLNQNFDLNITDYVTVNFSVVATAIDALGGMEIEITEDEIYYANLYIDEINEIMGKSSPHLTTPGLQTLDGVQATGYARIRHTAGDDYKRTERQRLVVSNMVEKAKSAGITTIMSLANEISPNVKTNLSSSQIVDLAKDALSYNLAEQTGFPFEKEAGSLPDNKGDFVFATDLAQNVKELHKFLFNDEDYTPSANAQSISDSINAKRGK